MSFENRVELAFLFDVRDGNPNGDPDAGNSPRIDPENGHGFVTDVCLKRKIRNFVALMKDYQPPNDIYVKDRGILRDEQRKAYDALKAKPGDRPNDEARDWMCANYFDVRTFGAVMSTGKADGGDASGQPKTEKPQKKKVPQYNCGQVRGPVQLGFARSQSRIDPMENVITRVALTNPGDTGRGESGDDEKAATGQFGRKYTIPYALYRGHGFISPFLAKKTGFGRGDYELLLQSIEHMFEHDRSASRGEMSLRALGVFEHESALGNAPAHQLFDLVRIAGPEVPRSFHDYEITRDIKPPAGVNFRWIVAPDAHVH